MDCRSFFLKYTRVGSIGKKTRTFLIYFIFISIFAGVVSISRNKDVTCDANVIIYKGNAALKLLISYYFFKDNGLVIISGDVYKGNKFVESVSFNVSFDYIREGNTYFMKSKEVSASIHRDLKLSSLEGYLPDFYLGSGVHWNIDIAKQSSGSLVFMSSRTPSFVCFIKR